jgi:hypothetical protein
MERDNSGSFSMLRFPIMAGPLDKMGPQPRKSLPEHFPKLTEDHKPGRDCLQVNYNIENICQCLKF